MFIHNINPIFISFGPISIRYYGIIYALGFVIGYLFLQHLAKKKLIKNLSPQKVEEYILFLMLAIVIGSRLGHFLFFHPSTFWTNPLEILMIWHGGLAFHGGILGAAAITWWYTKKHNINFWQITDALAILASFALFLGRIANFINAELVGRITNVPWAVNFNNEQINGELVYRHPSQLYESAKNLFNFFVLFITFNYNTKHKTLPHGYISWMFVTLYGLLRFITNFWRDDILFFGLSTGQWLSLTMFIVGVVMLIIWSKRIKKPKHHKIQ